MNPVLSSKRLEAFYVLAQQLSFSKAADKLCLTQSALSQRISQLEDSLTTKLFTRSQSCVELTDSGNKLLHYYRIKRSLETELVYELLHKKRDQLSGTLSIAGFSSIMRSVIMPLLAPVIRDNPNIQINYQIKNLRDLPDVLYSCEADLIIHQSPLNRSGYDNRLLGYEQNALIESELPNAINDVYLDHDVDDHFNEQFLHSQNKSLLQPLKRGFVSDIYGIIDGVVLGLGRGVVPLHMLTHVRGVKRVPGYSIYKTPCLLHFPKTKHHSRLHSKVIEFLSVACEDRLNVIE